MRLTEFEAKAIRDFFSERLPFGSKLYLFGSRTDDRKRGGDIDLLALVDEVSRDFVLSQRPMLLFDLQGIIGEQRIDLTVTSEQKIQSDLFLRTIILEALQISLWDHMNE